MKTRSRKKEIGIVSLGCAKNLVDSERLIRQMEEENVTVRFDPSPGPSFDAVIINTCGFIGDAKKESIDTILEFSESKKEGKIGALFVMGCLSQRYRQQLTEEIPEVDGFFGVSELASVVRAAGGNYRKELLGERRLTTPRHYAYLKIAEGCDRKCSFCAIPSIRGKHVSIPESRILREAETLAEQGVKELLVISQDTTYYGLDLYGKRSIARLLKKMAGIRGIEWIRLHYAYPNGFPMDLLDVMSKEEKICRYLDIPLQHISNRILHSMKRGMNSAGTRHLIETIRKKVPGTAIRTTFITGYPGETEAEFRELKSFMKEYRFERAGFFAYSEEEGTPASRLNDNVPERRKQARLQELMELQENISLEHNLTKTGTTLKVLVDREEPEYYVCRSEADSPEVDNEVLVRKGHNKLRPGRFYTVRVTGAGPFDLIAEEC